MPDLETSVVSVLESTTIARSAAEPTFNPAPSAASKASPVAAPSSASEPVVVDAFVDFHCPFSYRIVAWLDDLGPGHVTVRHRLFAIEQVNRDPAGESWRLWEQPLDYRHWKGMADRRPLLPFLAMAIVEAGEPPEVARTFRLALYAAKFDLGRDLSEIEVIEGAARMAGIAPRRLRAAIADPIRQAAARARIEADYRLGRADHEIFGVPTIRFEGDRPFYLRLERMVLTEDGPGLLETLRMVRRSPVAILELKVPEPVATPALLPGR